MERLDKRLSAAGYGRKEARELIRAGRVRVEGRLPAGPEERIGPAAAVTVDGAPLAAGFCCLMLHKPAGVVSSTGDPREKTVLELLPPELRRRGLFPVGRLDKDATGLLLLTDDGALAHALLSPKRHVDKTYRITVDGALDEADAAAFAAGLTLRDGTLCRPARLEPLGAGEALVTVQEGRYHQVKRMCAARGKPVLTLERVAFGPLRLDPALAPGQWRALTREEAAALRAAV